MVEIKRRRLLWAMRWRAKMSGEKRREHRPGVLRAKAGDGSVKRIVTLRMTRRSVPDSKSDSSSKRM